LNRIGRDSPRAQRGVRAELRGALSQRGKDRFRFRRVGDQSSGEQADGEETTDGVEPAWSTSSPADKNPRARRGVGEHLPALVSRFPPSSASQESGLTPENLPLSYLFAAQPEAAWRALRVLDVGRKRANGAGGPRQRVVATPGLGAADVTKNHPKCSKENRLNSPSKPLKC
jgi:hypothetical protein